MIRRPPRSTLDRSSAASDVYKRQVLYIGDHIYGDMLRAKKSSVWRTAMVIQELEGELMHYDHYKEKVDRLQNLDRQCSRLDSEITYQQMLIKALYKQPDSTETAKQEAKKQLEQLRNAY